MLGRKWLAEGYHHENQHCLSSGCDHGLRGHNFIAELSDSLGLYSTDPGAPSWAEENVLPLG